jgi:hypothetical protein
MTLKDIAFDKWKHFFVGMVLGILIQAGGWYFLGDRGLTSVLLTIGAVSVLSYGFELFSLWTGRGHYELADAIAGITGGLVGVGLLLLYRGF